MHSTPTPSPPFRLLLRIPVPWVFVLGYLIGVALERLLPPLRMAPRPHLTIQLAGAAVFLIGGMIAGWALLLFHRERTTTTPGEASSAFVNRGPYRFTRNPMYVGLTLAYLGEMGILAQAAPLLPLLLVLGYVNRTVIPVEEAKLRELFGQTYDDYRARVRRWI
jgi:protein-S-isoprenylcysteine O-methyltransferase Ste14